MKVNKIYLCNIISKYTYFSKTYAVNLLVTEEAFKHNKEVYLGETKPFHGNYFLSATAVIIDKFRSNYKLNITLDQGG